MIANDAAIGEQAAIKFLLGGGRDPPPKNVTKVIKRKQRLPRHKQSHPPHIVKRVDQLKIWIGRTIPMQEIHDTRAEQKEMSINAPLVAVRRLVRSQRTKPSG